MPATSLPYYNNNMKSKLLVLLWTVLLVTACHEKPEHRTVVCVPVYGQSLALGEEALRVTSFDSLATYANGRIVTERLNHDYGYFDNNAFKQWAKRITHYAKRDFELSIYQMAEILADQTGEDTLICIFPGGKGATALAQLSKGTPPYQRFMNDIRTAYEQAADNGWDFVVPAICWMQGESDIVDYPETDYQQLLTQLWSDMNEDIQAITHQQDSIHFVCYQPNSLSRAEHFQADSYQCRETMVPQTFVNLLRSDNRFWASGPTYAYHCVNDKIHIDALGQKAIGMLAARSVLGIIRGAERFRGLIPLQTAIRDHEVVITFNTPTPPLSFDTLQVRKTRHYGFSVMNQKNQDIADSVVLDSTMVRIVCSASPQGCKVRYAVNGDYMKSGSQYGPRGNLRDSAGNWCYLFDIPAE